MQYKVDGVGSKKALKTQIIQVFSIIFQYNSTAAALH